jgi:tetratricopeptide (TPR) repeat protein
MKNLLFLIGLLFVQTSFVSAQSNFAPSNVNGPVMKYEGLKDTDPSKDDPAMRARIEKGRKDWVLGKDTVLLQAKNLFDKKYYKEVIQLLFPYDYFEPGEGLFYEYFGRAYFELGYYSPALDCLKISFDQKKNNSLLYYMGYCNERLGDDKEAKRLYKKGAKEGDVRCVKALE